MNRKWLKLIRSLHQKKYRYELRKFFIEGEKILKEAIEYKVDGDILLCSEQFYNENIDASQKFNFPVEIVKEDDLKKAGVLKTNNAGIMVCPFLERESYYKDRSLLLALDDIRDPGNLGTIIRLADWYGIPEIYCSKTCVDVYNPKALAASMGGFLRVKTSYVGLDEIIKTQISDYQLIGSELNGISLKKVNDIIDGNKPKIIFIGNESRGLSDSLASSMDVNVRIDRFGEAESLNAAMATTLFLQHFKSIK